MELLSMNREAMAGRRERPPFLNLWKGGASHGNEGEGTPRGADQSLMGSQVEGGC